MRSFIKALLWILGIAALAFFISWAFLFTVHTSENNDMAPNLVRGDSFLVYTRSEIVRGDIVVCTDPRDETQRIVGRILGVPGDTLEINRGGLYLNGAQVEEGAEGEYVLVDDVGHGTPLTHELEVRVEYLGMNFYRVAWPQRTTRRAMRRVSVEDGSYFLLADNRGLGEDSRTYGQVPISTCIGRPWMIYRPGESAGDSGPRGRWFTFVR